MNPFDIAWTLLKAENLDHYKQIMGAAPGYAPQDYPPSPAMSEAEHIMSQQGQTPFRPEEESVSHEDIVRHMMDLKNELGLSDEEANHIYERLTGMHDEGHREEQAMPGQETPAPAPYSPDPQFSIGRPYNPHQTIADARKHDPSNYNWPD
jgi:hypothetical protein